MMKFFVIYLVVAIAMGCGTGVSSHPGTEHTPDSVPPTTNLLNGTNPAIAMGPDGPVIALHGAGSDLLWTFGPDGVGHRTSYVLAPGTNPAIAMGPSGPVIALHGANADFLWTVGPDGVGHQTIFVLAQASSPAIAMGPNGPVIALHGANTD